MRGQVWRRVRRHVIACACPFSLLALACVRLNRLMNINTFRGTCYVLELFPALVTLRCPFSVGSLLLWTPLVHSSISFAHKSPTAILQAFHLIGWFVPRNVYATERLRDVKLRSRTHTTAIAARHISEHLSNCCFPACL
jgi:hypothetical protein